MNHVRLLPRLILTSTACLAACGRAAEADAELPSGARVQFESDGTRGWTTGLVGTVGECTAIMVPGSWEAADRFDVVRIDDVRALRISTRYDGAPRVAPMPPDTAGEEWRALPLEAVRDRYADCDSQP